MNSQVIVVIMYDTEFVSELFAMRNAQSQYLSVKGLGKQLSMETEDEDADIRRLSWSQQLQTNSEERVSSLIASS